jgi:hypothetical protein
MICLLLSIDWENHTPLLLMNMALRSGMSTLLLLSFSEAQDDPLSVWVPAITSMAQQYPDIKTTQLSF